MTSAERNGTRSSSMTVGGEHDDRFLLIGRIASGLAHELNGPIGIALGFSELAKESLSKTGEAGLDADGVKKVNEYLSLVENAGLRARTLARQIWSFAKAEPGKTTEFDLVEALDGAAALAGPAVKVGQIEVSSRGEATAPAIVTADHAALTISLVRLFLDAVEALPKGGNVYWEVNDKQDGQWHFTLAAEPWGEMPSAEWPIQNSTRDAFRSQDGSIGNAEERRIDSSEADLAPSSPGWYVTASLPAADD